MAWTVSAVKAGGVGGASLEALVFPVDDMVSGRSTCFVRGLTRVDARRCNNQLSDCAEEACGILAGRASPDSANCRIVDKKANYL